MTTESHSVHISHKSYCYYYILFQFLFCISFSEQTLCKLNALSLYLFFLFFLGDMYSLHLIVCESAWPLLTKKSFPTKKEMKRKKTITNIKSRIWYKAKNNNWNVISTIKNPKSGTNKRTNNLDNSTESLNIIGFYMITFQKAFAFSYSIIIFHFILSGRCCNVTQSSVRNSHSIQTDIL